MKKTFAYLKKSMIAAVVALGVAATAPQAHALVILGLDIDASGSIGSVDFANQKTGYHNALTAVLPIDGSVAVGVWKFSTAVTPVFGVTLIDSAAAKTALIAAIDAMTYDGANTALGQVISDAATALVAYSNGSGNGTALDKLVIDVSTDGHDTVGGNPSAAATAAVAAGVDQVNCLGVGGGADCSFIAGTGSFSVNVSNFTADFENALIDKLAKETGQVPEPGTLTILGFGLAGLGALRRRKRQAA